MRPRLGAVAAHRLGRKSEPLLVRSYEALLSARAFGPNGGLDKARVEGRDHGLHAVADAELSEDAREVRLDRRLAEVEVRAELGVREPAGEQGEDLELALGQ